MKKCLLLLVFFFLFLPKSTQALTRYYFFDAKSHAFNRLGYVKYFGEAPEDKAKVWDVNQPPPGKTFDQMIQDYDTLLLLASIQGNVNRSKPTLFVNGTDEIDKRWLTELPAKDIWLQGSQQISLATIDDVINTFKDPKYGIKGSVVWNEQKPYTADIAGTIAGAENLVIVRQGSALYDRITAAFPVRVDLTDAGIGSQFTSKKSGYEWAINNYLKSGKSAPIPTFFKDGAQVQAMKNGKMFLIQNFGDPSNYILGWGTMMWDVAIAHRAFLYDLGPYNDDLIYDEPNQPRGEDTRTLRQIIAAARERVGPNALLDFWGYPNEKYARCGDGSILNGVICGEWPYAQLVSESGGAKRIGGGEQWGYEAPNLSFFQHGPGTDMVVQSAFLTPHQLLQKNYVNGYPYNFSFENNISNWTVDTTNVAVYDPSVGTITPSHGDNYLEVNVSNQDLNKKHNFFQDVPVQLLRGQRYKFSIRMRSATAEPVSFTPVVWGWKNGQAKLMCENHLTKSNRYWEEVGCEFQMTEDGYTSARIQVYLETPNKNYSFDEAYFDGVNTLTINPDKKFMLQYLGDVDFANAAVSQPFIKDFGVGDGRQIWSPVIDNKVTDFPIAWGLSSIISKEVPPIYAYLAKTKSPSEWITSAVTGAGYVNPGKMKDEVVSTWVRETTNLHRQLGYRMAWALEGFGFENVPCENGTLNLQPRPASPNGDQKPCNAGIGRKIRDQYKVIAPDGIIYGALEYPNLVDQGMGGAPMGDFSWAGLQSDAVYVNNGYGVWSAQEKNISADKRFMAFRNVFTSPKVIKEGFEGLQAQPQRFSNYEDVDPGTFFNLLRLSKNQVTWGRSTVIAHNIPSIMVKGQQYNISLTIRNDGWDIWVPKPGNNCNGNGEGHGCMAVAWGFQKGEDNPQGIGKHPTFNYDQRTDLPQVVNPGESFTVNFTITAPQDTGSYTFETDMVKELEYFLEHHGNTPWQRLVQVTDAPVDVNNDGVINYEDTEPGIGNYSQQGTGDVNGDGKVNALDIVHVRVNIKEPTLR